MLSLNTELNDLAMENHQFASFSYGSELVTAVRQGALDDIPRE